MLFMRTSKYAVLYSNIYDYIQPCHILYVPLILGFLLFKWVYMKANELTIYKRPNDKVFNKRSLYTDFNNRQHLHRIVRHPYHTCKTIQTIQITKNKYFKHQQTATTEYRFQTWDRHNNLIIYKSYIDYVHWNP